MPELMIVILVIDEDHKEDHQDGWLDRAVVSVSVFAIDTELQMDTHLKSKQRLPNSSRDSVWAMLNLCPLVPE